jgi:hypothetical protein
VTLAGKRSILLEEFIQRLFEQPTDQHYHSVSINKNNLFERYEEVVRDLIRRQPTLINERCHEMQRSSVPTVRATNPMPSVSIPVVVHRSDSHTAGTMPNVRSRSSTSMSHDHDEQSGSSTLPHS